MTLKETLGLSTAAIVLVSTAIYGDKVVSRQARTDRVTVIYWEKWTGDEAKDYFIGLRLGSLLPRSQPPTTTWLCLITTATRCHPSIL